MPFSSNSSGKGHEKAQMNLGWISFPSPNQSLWPARWVAGIEQESIPKTSGESDQGGNLAIT